MYRFQQYRSSEKTKQRCVKSSVFRVVSEGIIGEVGQKPFVAGVRKQKKGLAGAATK